MNPVLNLWQTYRRFGARGARTLSWYYAEKVRASLLGPGRECPICGWKGRQFHPAVYPAHGLWRARAVCPGCRSLERHRALWFAYQEALASFTRPRILHLAPERCFRTLFQTQASRYLTGNYDHEICDVRLDLVHLGLRDACIDLVVANGVMSSVPDHAGAVSHLHRVLAPGGSALICDLVTPGGVLTELAGSPMGVRRQFGTVDLQAAFRPFTATLDDLRSRLPADDRERFGITEDDFYLIRLSKPAAG